MTRKRRIRKELLDNGNLVSKAGVELARFDEAEGIYVINERALYRYLMMGTFYKNQTPLTKINMMFSMSGGWTFDPTVETVLREMEELKLVQIIYDDSGNPYAVRPIATVRTADRKLPKYRTRAEQFAGLEELNEE